MFSAEPVSPAAQPVEEQEPGVSSPVSRKRRHQDDLILFTHKRCVQEEPLDLSLPKRSTP